MKYSLHAFMTLNDFIDNTRHKDSPLGELSALGRTYATDLGYYTKDDAPGVRLVSFRSKTDDTADIEVPLAVRDLCIRLGKWLEAKANDRTISQNNVTNKQAIIAEFQQHIKDVNLGRVVTVKGIYLPQFIEFKLVDTATYSDSLIKIWFSDPAFKSQYPYYEIKIIPIVDNLDDFFLDVNSVQRIRNELNLETLHDKVNRLREDSPFTLLKTYNYQWKGDVTGDGISIPWTVLIYGGIGENLDIIKDELVKYILANSKKSRAEWEKIFPDLFVPTEYVIAPIWTMSSVPGFRTIASMYSPTIRYKDAIPFAKEAMKGYEEAHLKANLEISSCLYKSIGLLICGNAMNRLAPISFYEKYPQYALIGSRTDDFNRMDKQHQLMVLKLNELLLAAENIEPDTDTGLNLTKVIRNGVLYASVMYENIQFLCVARHNYTSGKLKGTSEALVRNRRSAVTEETSE